MATIWFLKKGQIQVGPAKAEKPIEWCAENLGLRTDHWYSNLQTRPLIIGEKTQLGADEPDRYVVVQIDEMDRSGTAWEAGVYLLDMDAREARKVLEKSN